jgi:hypothetical protein
MKKTLVIMGSHPSGRDFDWSRKDCEIWAFNEAPNQKKDGKLILPRVDVCFQLHVEAIWRNPANRTDPDHYKWLTTTKSKVYMQDKYPEIPGSIKYPLEDVVKMTGKRVFTSSPDYAFGLVAYLYKQRKWKKVEVWGIELAMESEYQYQRTGFSFWIGYLTALGIPLELHTKIFDSPMYGYEGDIAIPSTEFDRRKKELESKTNNTFEVEAKDLIDSLPKFIEGDISRDFTQRMNALIQKHEATGRLNGKVKENERYAGKAKIMEKTANEAIFAVGEFDGVRIDYTKQMIQVRNEAVALLQHMDESLKNLVRIKKHTQKRKRAINKFGLEVVDLINKNMLLAHLKGGIEENEYYLNSCKLSIAGAL